ncbi:hypothetical protein RYX36_031459 [Vicia faba]
MASHNPQKSFTNKQEKKRPMVSSSPPPVPKKARTKVQASKVTPDAKIKKKSSKDKKYNPDYVKRFYYNLVETPAGIESRFKDKVVKFTYSDFTKYLDLVSGGADIFVRFPDYDRISYVLSISKSVCEKPAMSNFGISQLILDINRVVSKKEDLTKALIFLDYDSQVHLKTDLRTELKSEIEASKDRVVAQVEYVRSAINHMGR